MVNGEALQIFADFDGEGCVEVVPMSWLLSVGRSILGGPGFTHFMRFAGGGFTCSLPPLDGLRSSSLLLEALSLELDIVAPGGDVSARG
jgi:hypothetical protein